MICRVCGKVIKQVVSATPELAMFQHLLWIHNILEKKQEVQFAPGDEPYEYPSEP